MKSKTKIRNQLRRKGRKELVTTLFNSKNDFWVGLAGILSGPRRIKIVMNLEKIDKESKEGETILIPGKILSQGEINKKMRIVAKEFSKKAEDKLLESKIDFSKIDEEIKKNPEAKGIRILR
jgi:large subunit ribosomal protein L18e